MIYQAILDASIVGSTLALVSIAYNLYKLTASRKFEEGGIVTTYPVVRTNYADFRPDPTIAVFAAGDRVSVKRDAGFSAGAAGTVRFQEPFPDKTRRCWVQRDGTESVTWFYNHELEPLSEKGKK